MTEEVFPYRIDESNTDTASDSGTDSHITVLRACLQRATEEREHASEDNSLLPAILVSERATKKATKHGSEVVHSNEATLLRCVRYDAVGADTDGLDVAGRAVDKAHHALVVALEDEGDG